MSSYNVFLSHILLILVSACLCLRHCYWRFLPFHSFYSGKNNGFPAVEAFGSFTMDLFTSNSDLDLSINFSNEMVDFPRDRKISVLRILADVLNDHQSKVIFLFFMSLKLHTTKKIGAKLWPTWLNVGCFCSCCLWLVYAQIVAILWLCTQISDILFLIILHKLLFPNF